MNDCAAVGIAEIRLSSQPALAQIKHLNRLEQILASVQMLTLGVDEGLMLDQAGHITSVIAGNFFMVKRGMLVTPRLVDCGVAGTRRRLIIEKWAPALGLIVQQSEISLKDLKDAEEVFYSNSLQTVRPVARVVDQHWASHNVCKALFECYLDELSA